jgi:hypothetical protein
MMHYIKAHKGTGQMKKLSSTTVNSKTNLKQGTPCPLLAENIASHENNDIINIDCDNNEDSLSESDSIEIISSTVTKVIYDSENVGDLANAIEQKHSDCGKLFTSTEEMFEHYNNAECFKTNTTEVQVMLPSQLSPKPTPLSAIPIKVSSLRTTAEIPIVETNRIVKETNVVTEVLIEETKTKRKMGNIGIDKYDDGNYDFKNAAKKIKVEDDEVIDIEQFYYFCLDCESLNPGCRIPVTMDLASHILQKKHSNFQPIIDEFPDMLETGALSIENISYNPIWHKKVVKEWKRLVSNTGASEVEQYKYQTPRKCLKCSEQFSHSVEMFLHIREKHIKKYFA